MKKRKWTLIHKRRKIGVSETKEKLLEQEKPEKIEEKSERVVAKPAETPEAKEETIVEKLEEQEKKQPIEEQAEKPAETEEEKKEKLKHGGKICPKCNKIIPAKWHHHTECGWDKTKEKMVGEIAEKEVEQQTEEASEETVASEEAEKEESKPETEQAN